MPDAAKQDRARVAGIGVAAVLLMASNFLSRALGFGREVLLAAIGGSGPDVDAYVAAFLIPDLLNHILASSAFAMAFIPLYTAKRTEHGEAAGNRFLGTVLGTVGALALAATVILWLGADLLVAAVFPAFDQETQALTARLMRIVLPGQLFFWVGGTLKATLLARGRFGAAAVAPLAYNVCVLAGGAALGPFLGVEGFAWGVLAGAFVGPFLAPLIDAWPRIQFRLRFAPLDPDILRYLLLALPLMLGFTLVTVDEWYEKIFGAAVSAGTISNLNYARKLMLVPVGVLGQAVATAALPALAQLWADGQRERVNQTLTNTLRATIAVGIVMAAGLWLVADPLASVVYERVAGLDQQNTLAIAAILAVLALAIPAWVGQQVINRAFYARSDTWRPMLLGTAMAVLALPIYWYLGKKHGATGLAWAGVVSMSVATLATILMARRLHQAPPLQALLGTSARSLGIAGLATVVGLATRTWTKSLTATLPPWPQTITELLVSGVAFGVVAVVGLRVLGDEPTRQVLHRVTQRLRRRAKN